MLDKIKVWIFLYILALSSTNKAVSQSLLKQLLSLDDSESGSYIWDWDDSKINGFFPNKESEVISKLDSGNKDSTYILSKLSDDDLIKLLSVASKNNQYNIDEVINIALNNKEAVKNSVQESPAYEYVTESEIKDTPVAYFKIDTNKPVRPYKENSNFDPNYAALQKIYSVLKNNRNKIEESKESEESDARSVFDSLMSGVITQGLDNNKSKRYKKVSNTEPKNRSPKYAEKLFLVVNMDVKSEDTDKMVYVDSDSFGDNSVVLLLGSAPPSLSDEELQPVINRVAEELSSPEYLPLLQQLSKGTFTNENVALMKNLITGRARRYMKPQRCNYQAPLSKVFGGPRWLVCTGYINMNGPSLYDR